MARTIQTPSNHSDGRTAGLFDRVDAVHRHRAPHRRSGADSPGDGKRPFGRTETFRLEIIAPMRLSAHLRLSHRIRGSRSVSLPDPVTWRPTCSIPPRLFLGVGLIEE